MLLLVDICLMVLDFLPISVALYLLLFSSRARIGPMEQAVMAGGVSSFAHIAQLVFFRQSYLSGQLEDQSQIRLYTSLCIVMELIRFAFGSIMLSTLTMFARTLVVGPNYHIGMFGYEVDMERVTRVFRVVVFVVYTLICGLWTSYGLDLTFETYKMYRRAFYTSLAGVSIFVSLPVITFYCSRLMVVTREVSGSRHPKKDIQGKINTAYYLFLISAISYAYVGISNTVTLLAYETTPPESAFNLYSKIVDSCMWSLFENLYVIGFLWNNSLKLSNRDLQHSESVPKTGRSETGDPVFDATMPQLITDAYPISCPTAASGGSIQATWSNTTTTTTTSSPASGLGAVFGTLAVVFILLGHLSFWIARKRQEERFRNNYQSLPLTNTFAFHMKWTRPFHLYGSESAATQDPLMWMKPVESVAEAPVATGFQLPTMPAVVYNPVWTPSVPLLSFLLSLFLSLPLIQGKENPALDQALQLMKLGKVQEALGFYDKAIETDPSNHVTFYRRATAYLTLGRNEQAIRDFDSVLALKADNHPARLKRAQLLLYQGKIPECLEDIKVYLDSHAQDEKALELLERAQEGLAALSALNRAKKDDCPMEELSTLIRISPKNPQLLERFDDGRTNRRRAECHLKLGEKDLAVFDFSRLIKLAPTRNDISIRLAELYLEMGELDSGVSAIKECLHNDPDERSCKKVFRRIKNLQKGLRKAEGLGEKGKWRDLTGFLVGDSDSDGFLKEVEELDSKELKTKVYGLLCSSYHGMKKHKETIDYCSRVIDVQDNGNVRANRADAYLAQDDFEKAKVDFKAAHDTDSQNSRYVDGYRKAEALQKRAGMRDYYKILGVPRTASQRDIKRAYRKLAQVSLTDSRKEYHPDKYKGDLDKEAVLKKMSEINIANEVLGNEESRAKYDQGDDPNDPNQGRQGGNPFGGGGFPFQGFPGGFQFQQGGGHQFHFQF
ncbi:hypothetical protein HDU91_005083 [Kappamyces sp. JEL0680]|nr:hypothetical protein HDU91_005083 [Kappamyces sp. JEL0680]